MYAGVRGRVACGGLNDEVETVLTQMIRDFEEWLQARLTVVYVKNRDKRKDNKRVMRRELGRRC